MSPSRLDLSGAKRALLDEALAARGLARDREIPRRPGGAPARLSFAQRRLWFLDQLEPGSAAYVIPASLRVGDVDAGLLQGSLQVLAERHEALRTTFRPGTPEPEQVVSTDARLPLVVDELTALPAEARVAGAAAIARDEATRPFDLERGPLARARLVRTGPGEGLLLLTLHHIVADGWSVALAFRELTEVYAALGEGREPRLAPLRLGYADFAEWQRDRLAGPYLEDELAYWRAELEGMGALDLPTDRPRSGDVRREAGLCPVLLDAAETAGLRALAARTGASLFMAVVAALAATLGGLTGSDDVGVGIPVANRERLELEGVFGFFVNTLVVRCRLEDDPSFAEVLRRVRATSLSAYSHSELPFDLIVEALAPPRDPGRNPLLDVVAQLFPLAGEGVPPPAPAAAEAKFDLYLVLWETPTELAGRLEYRRDLFDEATVAQLVERIRLLVRTAVADPDLPVSRIDLLLPGERERLLGAWGGSPVPYPRDATVDELFREQAARTPDAPAVVGDGETVTYAELQRRADGLSDVLAAAGVREETLVGVFLERSPAFVVAALGVVGAGGAYVPLDPAYPPERLRFMVGDCAAPVIVSSAELAPRLPSWPGRLVLIEDVEAPAAVSRPAARGRAGRLAYVMYTSGSTGVPKGVCVEHRGIVRLVCGADYAELGPDEALIMLAPTAFDASTFEIWGALLNGGRVVVPPPGPLSVEEVGAIVRRHGVTTIFLTSVLFDQIVDAGPDALAGVRQVLAGGDVLSSDHVRRALQGLPGCAVSNVYGPTENTTFTTHHRMRSPADVDPVLPIGRPIANSRVYVLDEHLGLVAPGVAGELYVAGDGLARGYLGRPELTGERFLPDPFGAPGGRMYRTGDRVRHRRDGALEFLGRVDDQLKIRGHRVEPGEVAHLLRRHPGVADAVVVAREDTPGDRRLIAYVVPDRAGRGDLRAALLRLAREQLPEYMVPGDVVVVDELPLSANGKLDRARLPAPGPRRTGGAPAESTLEREVGDVFSDVLGGEEVGIHDDFFADLGGHSLLATQVVSRLRAAFAVDLPLRRLFEAPTVAAIAAAIEELVLAEVEALSDDEVRREIAEAGAS